MIAVSSVSLQIFSVCFFFLFSAKLSGMNDKDLEKKIKDEMEREIEASGCSTPADLLIALGYLDEGAFADWQKGRLSYLEKALKLGPQKVLRLMAVMSAHAKKEGYKPKFFDYSLDGKTKLRFSRTGNEVIEGQFATRYIDKYWREDD